MSNRRSIVEVIDEMLAVIPADQTGFIASLDLLVQSIRPDRKDLAPLYWQQLGDICEFYMGAVPSKAWHFHLASVIYKRPVAVIMNEFQQFSKEHA